MQELDGSSASVVELISTQTHHCHHRTCSAVCGSGGSSCSSERGRDWGSRSCFKLPLEVLQFQLMTAVCRERWSNLCTLVRKVSPTECRVFRRSEVHGHHASVMKHAGSSASRVGWLLQALSSHGGGCLWFSAAPVGRSSGRACVRASCEVFEGRDVGHERPLSVVKSGFPHVFVHHIGSELFCGRIK